eukprot:4182446-Amphidinium_carterae.2
MQRQVPKHFGRPGAVDEDRPRSQDSQLLGAYVVRGVGISRATDSVHSRRVLAIVHQLARLRPGCDTSLAYLSVNLNQNPVLAAHTDRSNLGWSWNLALGSYTGGQLWVRSPNGKESPPPGSQNMEWRGRLLNPHRKWIEFDGLVEHGVTESEGYRVSITLFSPRAHVKLHLGHWRRLHKQGFPIRSGRASAANVSALPRLPSAKCF